MPSCLNHQACLICTIHFSFKLGRWAARETDEDAGKEVKNANIGPKRLEGFEILAPLRGAFVLVFRRVVRRGEDAYRRVGVGATDNPD
jgi:hypothetical protein